MYKIVPAERQDRPKEMITKTAVNHRKRLTAVILAPPARLELTTFRLGGGPSIPVRYGGIYRKYSILQGSGVRTDRLLGGDRSIQLSYGGLYRKYSILQGSRIRTIRFLGGGPSILVRYGGILSLNIVPHLHSVVNSVGANKVHGKFIDGAVGLCYTQETDDAVYFIHKDCCIWKSSWKSCACC